MHDLLLNPQDEDSAFLRNVGKLLRDYIASHPRKYCHLTYYLRGVFVCMSRLEMLL
jgi:hypothetical protein